MRNGSLIKNIAKTGTSAVKSFLGFDSATPLLSNNYRQVGQPFGNSGWLFDTPSPGVDVYFSYCGLQDIVTAYESCAPVYSIVNKQAMCLLNGKTWVIDKKGKEVNSFFAKKIKTLLEKPNPMQNGRGFEAQLSIYLRLFGYCIILPITPVGYGREDSQSMWIIPPYMCDIVPNEETFYYLKKGFIKSIKLTYGSEVSYLDPEQVIIIRDITPSFNSTYLPGSPIKPLQQNISNLIGIYNSKGTLINYRGALGILSPEIDPNGAVAQDPQEVEDVQNGLLRYGVKRGQWKFIVTTASMKWQQIGIPYKDLMLTEWAEDDTMIICDALNYPYKLLSNAKSATLNGTEVDSFKKSHYQDFIIPYAEMIYEQLTEAFNMKEFGCRLDKDFSHISVLQDDKVNSGRARLYLNQALLIEWQNNLITANQWLEMNGLDPVADGDQYYSDWVKTGKSFNSTALQTPAADQGNAADDNSKNKK